MWKIIFREIDVVSLLVKQSNGFNSDLKTRVVLIETEEKWRSSPADGVKRLFLDRTDFSEYTSATTIVKFAKNSRFSKHSHQNGEEFFVLEGIFSDEYGDYPKGTYVRNPHGTRHSPYSKEGCKIFVKLRQFQKEDNKRIVKSMFEPWKKYNTKVNYLHLHNFKNEIAYLVKFEPHSAVDLPFRSNGGEEILILSGGIRDRKKNFTAITWIRDPKRCLVEAYAGANGACVFVKTGHLF